MKHVSICFLLTVVVVLSGVLLYAQEEVPHVFTVTTFELLSPEGGSNAEFDSLSALWNENVIKKNEFIISEETMTHLWGSNALDFVVITEHKNFADIENAGNRNIELLREAWPDTTARREYTRAYSKYFGNHKDEIYQAYTSVRK